jgi:hypothetical protein
MRALSQTLGLLALLTILSSSRAQDVTVAPAAAVNPNPLSSLSLEDLSATRSFPLFTPSRTAPLAAEEPLEPEPVEIEEPVVDPEQPPPPLQLVGIVLTDATQTALLLDSQSQEVHRLTSGDEYEGWSLTIVDARSVEFRSGDRVEGLRMFESFPSPPTMSEVPDFSGIEAPAGSIPGDLPPDMMLVPDEGAPPAKDEMQPAETGEPVPDEPPVDFDPALGTVPIPEEGPLPSNANRGGNSG